MSNNSSPRSDTISSCPALWTELASLTVAAFKPDVVDHLRKIAALEVFDPTAHLPLLGAIVVRHARLLLEENDQPSSLESTPCSCQDEKPFSKSKSTNTIPRRASYRDVAYHAVRLRKIVPAVQDDRSQQDQSSENTNTNSLPRRLSIHVPRRPRSSYNPSKKLTKSEKVTKTVSFHKSSKKQPVSTQNKSLNSAARDEYDDDNADEFDEASPDLLIVKKRSIPSFWNSSKSIPFPRASGADTIETPSSRKLKYRQTDTKENVEVIANNFNKPTTSGKRQTPPVSRLVQMRKDRSEKRKNKIVQQGTTRESPNRNT